MVVFDELISDNIPSGGYGGLGGTGFRWLSLLECGVVLKGLTLENFSNKGMVV